MCCRVHDGPKAENVIVGVAGRDRPGRRGAAAGGDMTTGAIADVATHGDVLQES